MVKRVILVLLVFILLIPLSFLGWRYIQYLGEDDPGKTFLSPQVRFIHLNITDFREDKIELTGDILLKNQLPFSIKADSIEYSISMNGVNIMKSRSHEKLLIAPRDSAWLSLPVSIKKRDLDSIGAALDKVKEDSADYEIDMKFYLPYKLVKTWTRKTKKRGLVFHLLDTKLEKIKVSSLKKKEAEFRIFLAFKNDNSFPIAVRDIDYTIYINKDVLTKGHRKGLLKFAAKKTTHIDFPAGITYGDMGKTLLLYLNPAKHSQYKFELAFTIETKNKKINGRRTVMTRSGPLEEVLDFNKDKD